MRTGRCPSSVLVLLWSCCHSVFNAVFNVQAVTDSAGVVTPFFNGALSQRPSKFSPVHYEYIMKDGKNI